MRLSTPRVLSPHRPPGLWKDAWLIATQGQPLPTSHTETSIAYLPQMGYFRKCKLLNPCITIFFCTWHPHTAWLTVSGRLACNCFSNNFTSPSMVYCQTHKLRRWVTRIPKPFLFAISSIEIILATLQLELLLNSLGNGEVGMETQVLVWMFNECEKMWQCSVKSVRVDKGISNDRGLGSRLLITMRSVTFDI